MPEGEATARRAWLSHTFHGLLVAILLVAIGFRLQGYFFPEQKQETTQPDVVGELTIQELRETGNEAFEEEQWHLAADAYGRLASLNSENTRSRIRLAYSLHRSGQHDAALLEFLYLCRYEGNVRRWALYNAACSYALKGEERLALDYLRTAVTEGYRHPNGAIQDDEDFASLRDNADFQRLAELVKPYTQRELYRCFDFLVGRWKLVRENDSPLGQLTVTKGREGSSIRGEFEDASISLSLTLFGYVDPADDKWQHVWLDNQGNVMQLHGGELEGESFLMQGTHTSTRSIRKQARAIYTSLDDGTVKMELSTSIDKGDTWAPILNATLVPSEEAREASGDE